MATVNQLAALNPAKPSAKEDPIGDSSFIAKIKYDPAQLQLTVTMKNGSEYVHFFVFPATYDEFMRSPSKGTFYNGIIKGKSVSTRTISKGTGPQERNLARGPVKEQGRTHGR